MKSATVLASITLHYTVDLDLDIQVWMYVYDELLAGLFVQRGGAPLIILSADWGRGRPVLTDQTVQWGFEEDPERLAQWWHTTGLSYWLFNWTHMTYKCKLTDCFAWGCGHCWMLLSPALTLIFLICFLTLKPQAGRLGVSPCTERSTGQRY